ncbi:MAG: PHB depolymerase family esterase [Polyangiales bacterium]
MRCERLPLAGLALLAGCADDATRLDWSPGDYPADRHAQTYLELTDLPGQGGRTRGYKVHVPPSYDASTPTPVVYAIHGYTQNAVGFAVDGSDLVRVSDAEGFVLVMPNGIQGEDVLGGSWNAGSCCGVAGEQHIDDVGFLRAVHREIRKHLNVDRGRVYATGFSNGGFLSNRLACEASDLFVAIAPLAGAIGIPGLTPFSMVAAPDFRECEPEEPVSVLLMHGTSDPLVRFANVQPTFEHWAKVDGCGTTTVPAEQPRSGGDTTCVTYQGCPTGIEVTSCHVQAGGHCFFGDPQCGTGAGDLGTAIVGKNSDTLNATRDAWAFLSRFRRGD